MSTVLLTPNALSLEFLDTGFRKLADNLTKALHLYMHDMQSYMASTVKSLSSSTTIGFAPNPTLDKYVAEAHYINLAEVGIPVPVGLNVPLKEYLDALELNQAIVDRLLKDTYKPAIAYFSTLLASPEQLASVSIQREEAKILRFNDDREDAVKAVSGCFVKNDRVEYVRYGDVYARNADWVSCNKRLVDLTAKLATTPPSLVNTQVNTLCELIDKLADRIRQSPDTYAVTGINAKGISQLAYDLARVTEFYGAYYFLVQTLVASMDDTAKKIRSVI